VRVGLRSGEYPDGRGSDKPFERSGRGRAVTVLRTSPPRSDLGGQDVSGDPSRYEGVARFAHVHPVHVHGIAHVGEHIAQIVNQAWWSLAFSRA
jgi:hypothetical protein